MIFLMEPQNIKTTRVEREGENDTRELARVSLILQKRVM
jgi:hypothetical protein